MSEKIRSVIIAGAFSIVAAAITGYFSYHAGINSVSVETSNNNHIVISINGETVSVKPEEYQNMYEENIALKRENDQLKEVKDMLDVARAYQSFHYKEYSQRSSKAVSFSIAGKQYYNGMVWSAWNTGYSLYSLEGKYVEVTGMLGHIDESDKGETSLQIYFDGELHEEVPLSSEMVAQPFSIDVTGVNQLKLMVLHSRGSYGYADVKIR